MNPFTARMSYVYGSDMQRLTSEPRMAREGVRVANGPTARPTPGLGEEAADAQGLKETT